MVWSIFYEAKRHPRYATEFSTLQSNPEHPQQNIKELLHTVVSMEDYDEQAHRVDGLSFNEAFVDSSGNVHEINQLNASQLNSRLKYWILGDAFLTIEVIGD